jgi:predicted Rossmann-fold nucleotide-binding protein
MPTQIEIHDLPALAAHLGARGDLQGVVCQNLDLGALTDALLGVSGAGSLFLGCRLADRAKLHLIETGALIFPRLPELPFDPYRTRLYQLEELMAGFRPGRPGSFQTDTRDSAIYRHFTRLRLQSGPPPVLETLAQRLHDHSIDNALHELLTAYPRVVAIMGGHAVTRGQPEYRTVAQLGRALARAGYLVVTGGGPGAMEAANLGAWIAGSDDAALDEALALLAAEPDYRADGYLEAGYRVLARYPTGGESLAIPTWFYGHEPTNQFATHIAKYFANSLREDGLLAIATHGVVYAPGSAGTVQEMFMDATQNHYGTFHWVSPMVLFGRHYWTDRLPALPLLETLAEGRQYRDRIAVSDSPAEIVDFLLAHPPVAYEG